MFICKPKKFFCRARKGLGTSLALQCYAGLVSSGFLCKVAKDMTTVDKGKLLIIFVFLFTLSLLRNFVCSLWLYKLLCGSLEPSESR